MKKILLLAFALVALAVSTPTFAQNKKTTTQQAAPMSIETFAKKWGNYYDAFCDGQIQYGWPKQFFLDLMKAMPNHFKMKMLETQGGVTYYVFALILPNNRDVNAGGIGFQGTKLYEAQVDRWSLDYEYAQQLQELLDWDFDLDKL